MRARAALIACALALAPAVVRAQQVVTPIPAPQKPALAAQTPEIEPPGDLGDLAGASVTRVLVVLEGNVWDDVPVPVVRSVRVGEPLTAEVARRALGEVLATGAFARGHVTSAAEPGGAVVVVRAVPRKLVKRLKLEVRGARLDRDEILAAAEVADGGELVSADLDLARGRVHRFFAAHGFPSAVVEIATRDAEPGHALVFLDVDAGPARVIQARHVYVFGASPDKVSALTDGYAVRQGDRADESALAAADAALEGALHSGGWYRAAVGHDLVSVAPSPGAPAKVTLRVRVDAGAQVIPRFDGNDHYDVQALTSALGLDKETDRSASHLADKIRGFYEKRGYLDAEVKAELRGAEGDPVQVLAFRVVEHGRTRVVARRYPCLKVDTIRHLSSGGPRSSAEIGTEIDSFLEEELPGAQLFVNPDPAGVSDTFGGGTEGTRAEPTTLHADTTYVGDTYERAAQHVQELYRNEGFLHAQVGPVQVIRARCDPRSPPRRCVERPLPPMAVEECTYDPGGMPLPVAPLDPAFTCRPDPDHGVECAPIVRLHVPVKLGPRTQLWDVSFSGVRTAAEKDVAAAAEVPVGDYVSITKLDDARRRIADWYKELGYAYVDVKYALVPSLDSTRAGVRFDVTEGDQVIVTGINVHGLSQTRESVVRRRIALAVGQPYRTSDVRRTQERLATLGVFSSIQVGLADPYVPEPRKTVDIDVVEAPAQYVEVRPGFSTGEGIRGTLEYGFRNLFGNAWSVTFHVQASYAPDFLIQNPEAATNWATLSTADRIATRNTVTLGFPDIGLGPTVRSQLDGIYVRDLEPDFTLVKAAVVGTLTWRPERQFQVSGGPDFENNSVHLFDAATISDYLNLNQGNTQLTQLLRVPDGESNVVAGKVTVTWDRRDAPFNAHRGTYAAAGFEQVNSFPVAGTANPQEQFEGHFLRLTQTLAGYVPITKSVAFAAELRLGEIVNVLPCTALQQTVPPTPIPYCTYPDRQFYMGGFDSMRGWLQDAFIPQEYIRQIDAGQISCTSQASCAVPLRGGNFMVNPRFELRFPVRPPLDAAIFTDFGNLWTDPADVLQDGLVIRADVGAGIRVQTPVGPLVFDYGFNVTRKSYEDVGAFHFAIGLF